MNVPPLTDVIIPAFNESQSIGKVVRAIPKDIIRHVVVCDNHSTDDTAAQAARAGAVVVHQPLRGYGHACLAGIEYVKNTYPLAPPDIVVFMDGDFSDYPEELPRLISPILAGQDMVIGSRVTGRAAPGSLTLPQRFGNWLATRLIRLFFGVRYTDLGPFRAIRWDILMNLDMQDKTYGWTVEMQVKAAKQNLQSCEVPVSYRKRIGKSKVSGTVKGTFMAGYKILWTIFKSI